VREVGDYGTACALAQESLETARQLGDRRAIANSLNNLGLAREALCDQGSARALLQESLAIFCDLGDRRGAAEGLEAIARLDEAAGTALSAVCLWGAAARMREDIGVPLPPGEATRYQRHLNAARSTLNGGSAFDEAWAEGRAMTMEEAIALALDEG
jgi:hypothetical protein